ncbi:MAG: hypothetical protein RIC03_07035 [Cyclobacteriaceae bacterium]
MIEYFVSLEEETVYRSKKFNKKEIETAFLKACEDSKPGDQIEYWKATKAHPWNPLLTCENIKGTIKREVIKGTKAYYCSFNGFR